MVTLPVQAPRYCYDSNSMVTIITVIILIRTETKKLKAIARSKSVPADGKRCSQKKQLE